MYITLACMAVTVISAASWVGWQSGVKNGIFSGIAGVIGIGIYLAIRNPPGSSGRKGADQIDFGR